MSIPTRRKLTGVTLGMVIALLAVPPAPVSAHEPADQQQLNPSHFNGDDRCGYYHGPCPPYSDAGETNEAQVASDLFDGVDSLYTMRALATPEALYYDWYHCPDDGVNVFDPNGGCVLIARDPTPTLSQPAPGIAPVAAFEATYDIPSNIQSGKTFRALACIEGPPITAAHCFGDRTGVHFDDASSTTDHPIKTDSGQITQPAHAAAVSNGGFTAVAFTSQSDIGRLFFCLDVGTSATQSETASPGQGCDTGSAADPTPDDAPCGPVPAGADCWAVSIDPPDNNEFSLGIVEQDDPTGPVSSGAGDCEEDTHVGGDGANSGDDCQFDKIYLTSNPGDADLALTKTGPPGRVPTGRNMSYTLDVHNDGPDAALEVAVNDQLPSSVSFVWATPSQGSCDESGGIVTCLLGAIPKEGVASIEITVRPNSAGRITNTASVSAFTVDPNETNNSDSVETSVCRITSRRSSIPCP
jgi:uncharacterized repeat protein (TIGR01451 family)